MLALKYAVFALVSTLVNLLFQYFSFQLYEGWGALYAAMAAGTLAGLVVKYVLDKKWIFYHTPKDRKDDARKFMLYTFMGAFTTVIFWGTEIAFNTLFTAPSAKYIGGAIGLTAGYVVKYFLDRKYVFTHKEEVFV